MLPFIRVSDISVLGLPIHTFGVLVATAVILGTSITMRRARQRGIDEALLNSFITWILVSGFICAHVLNDLMYEPELIKKDPLRLLRIWESISSFGGFTGALLGMVLWKYFEAIPWIPLPMGIGTIHKFRKRREPMQIIPFADLVMSVFPVAWIFGRSGCTIAHDHIGQVAPAGVAIAVAAPSPDVRSLMSVYKGPPFFKLEWGDYPRYDLGLLELIFTVILSVFVVITWRKKLPTGTYLAIAALSYAPVRFVMDSFRLSENDARYGGKFLGALGTDPAGLTPAQFYCVALFAAGLWIANLAWKNSKKAEDPMDYYFVERVRRRDAITA